MKDLIRMQEMEASQSSMTIRLLEGERIDDLQRNNYKIIQNPEKFCFGMDAVLLTGFISETIKNNAVALDMCTGTGIIPILLMAKSNISHFTAIELQEESADMARRSVELNGLQDKINVVTGDIKEAGDIFDPASFEVITCNPPYMPVGKGLKNPDGPMAIARHEIMCDIEDVIKQSSKLLKSSGKLYLVHRPNRLSEIFGFMHKYHLEPKRMRLVHPYADKEPNMVLIEAAKGGKPFLKIERPLVVYKSQNQYTDEIYDIYGMERP